MESDAVVVPMAPRMPQEIIDEILDYLETDFRSLESCSLVSKSWVTSCRRHLFHAIIFTWTTIPRWVEVFPVPEESPAHHVRDLRFSIRCFFKIPEGFSEHVPWFTNVEKVTWSGEMGLRRLYQMLSLGRLSQSVTSLSLAWDEEALLQIRDILLLFPNLSNLKLVGSFAGSRPQGIGTVLSGRLCGRLQLFTFEKDHRSDVVEMLLEAPAGLHFTEVEIRSCYECLLSTVALVEACGETLVKFSYTVENHCKSLIYLCQKNADSDTILASGDPETFEQSFDFMKLPNLKEAEFILGWTSGGLHWIPVALSTIKPTTSSRLSVVQVVIRNRSSWHVIMVSRERLADDIQLINGEVSRIEQEFENTMDLTVELPPGF